jgi:hypothetical protein
MGLRLHGSIACTSNALAFIGQSPLLPHLITRHDLP